MCIRDRYGLVLSPNKTKVMAFRGKYPVRTKIEVNGNILEQVSSFNYLGCEISPAVDYDVKNKLNLNIYVGPVSYTHLVGTRC